jgi:ADP-ribosylation factor-like protein 8/Arf/Sar family protein
MQQQIHSILTSNLKEIKEIPKEISSLIGNNLIIFGLQAVGKSCIAQRLLTGQFPPTIKPTLAPNILKIAFEQINFRIFDVSGQKKFRVQWHTTCPHPSIIVYVTDASQNEDHLQESIVEFQRIIDEYFSPNISIPIQMTTPILVIANKIDLNPNLTIEQLEDWYHLDQYPLNLHYGLVSALTGEGIEENFMWGVSQLIN